MVDEFWEHGSPRSSHSNRGRAAESCIISRFVNEKEQSRVLGEGQLLARPWSKGEVELADDGLNVRTSPPVGVLTG